MPMRRACRACLYIQKCSSTDAALIIVGFCDAGYLPVPWTLDLRPWQHLQDKG